MKAADLPSSLPGWTVSHATCPFALDLCRLSPRKRPPPPDFSSLGGRQSNVQGGGASAAPAHLEWTQVIVCARSLLLTREGLPHACCDAEMKPEIDTKPNQTKPEPNRTEPNQYICWEYQTKTAAPYCRIN